LLHFTNSVSFHYVLFKTKVYIVSESLHSVHRCCRSFDQIYQFPQLLVRYNDCNRPVPMPCRSLDYVDIGLGMWNNICRTHVLYMHSIAVQGHTDFDVLYC
jgi:hypothetical protein